MYQYFSYPGDDLCVLTFFPPTSSFLFFHWFFIFFFLPGLLQPVFHPPIRWFCPSSPEWSPCRRSFPLFLFRDPFRFFSAPALRNFSLSFRMVPPVLVPRFPPALRALWRTTNSNISSFCVVTVFPPKQMSTRSPPLVPRQPFSRATDFVCPGRLKPTFPPCLCHIGFSFLTGYLLPLFLAFFSAQWWSERRSLVFFPLLYYRD